MGTSSGQKWQKYFANKTVETVIRYKDKEKKPAIFNHEDGKTTSKLKAGEPITVLETRTYNAQQPIKYKETEGTVSIDNIEKPGISAAKQKGVFKPQTFGITGENMKIGPYAKAVLEHINESTDIGGSLAIYLRALVNHYVGNPKTTTSELTEIWKMVEYPPINDINNDFGEIMGPIALFKSSPPIGKAKGLIFNASSLINIPTAPNEPLMDFAIFPKIKGMPKQCTFSSKSLATKQTNTVKCQDIFGLLEKPQNEFQNFSPKEFHEKTDQYKMLRLLCDHPMVQGGYAIGNYLLSKGGKYKTKEWFEGLDNYDAIKKLNGNPTKLPTSVFMEEHFGVYMDNNNIPQNERTPIGVLYNIEKKIAKLTKEDTKLKFNELFADAVRNQIIYIKFQVNKSNGLPEWKLETSPDFTKSKGIHLRSKTTKNRLTDKIGVQT